MNLLVRDFLRHTNVLVFVVQPENQEGHAVVSIDRARQEKSWRKLQEIYEANEVIEAEGLSIVDFWAVWCGPCRLVAPIVEQLANDYGERGLRVSKLDVDQNPVTASRYGIRSIPTILFFKDGELVDRVIGAVPRPHLEQKVKEHLGA